MMQVYPSLLKRINNTRKKKRKGKETFYSLLQVDLGEGIPNSLGLNDDN